MRISDWSSDVCSSDLRTFEAGNIGRHLVVEALDIAVLHRRADEGGGEALRDRKARPAAFGAIAELVCLQPDLAILNDDESRVALFVHIGVDIDPQVDRLALGERKGAAACLDRVDDHLRSEEHTSELQSLMRSSYAVFCWKKKRYIHH